MSRKFTAVLVMALGIGAGIPAAAQLMPPLNTGVGRYMVQYRSGPGWPWRLYMRTRSYRRAYMIAAQIRTSGYQARVVYGSYYGSMPYYGYGYGYGYPRMYWRGYRRYNGYGGYPYGYSNYAALTGNNVQGAINALRAGSKTNPLINRLVPGGPPATGTGTTGTTNATASRTTSATPMARTQGQSALVHHVTRHALGVSGGSAGVLSQMASLHAHTAGASGLSARTNTAGQHAAMNHAAVQINRGMGGMPGGGFRMSSFHAPAMRAPTGGGFHGMSMGGGFHGGGFHGGGGGHGGGGHR